MHPYIPHTEEDIRLMLDRVGAKSLDALFDDIPHEALLKEPLNLPEAHSEQAILKRIGEIAKENTATSEWLRFVGGGLYEHGIPSIVPYLLSRSEFSTAYTPYQPEISQGTLQAIFEYQTMISELTGLPIANASHYDGSTALAEAAFMAASATRRQELLVADTVPEQSLNVLKSYAAYKGLEIITIPSKNGLIDQEAVTAQLSKNTAALIAASPNAHGLVEDYSGLAEALHGNKTLMILSSNPMSLALYRSPGEWGADIAVGDAQVFGNPLNFGGPSLGYITCTEKLMRKIPGRIVGQTVDLDGERGYVLTLQAREQHIRREKATSNITSNQALNGLAATIYLSVMGLKGIREVADRSRVNAHYLKDQLTAIDGIDSAFDGPFYNEFEVTVSNRDQLVAALEASKIIPGIQVGEDRLLIATTEIHDKEALDRLTEAVKEVLI